MVQQSRKLRSASSLALSNPAYQRLKLALDQHAKLLSAVREQIPAELANACYHAQIRNRVLLLHLETAAWASRLRYLAPKLLSALRREYPGLKSIQVRVRPSGTGRPARRQARLSAPAREALAKAADGLTDTRLSAALARLSKLGRKP